MQIIKNNYFLCFLIFSGFIYSQEKNVFFNMPIAHVIVRDSWGDIQSRSIISPLWSPVIGGIRIPEKSFIRLNTPESTLTLGFPDGSLLRLIGLSSIYLEYILKPINNTYQTKLLLLYGRWFYHAIPNEKSRLVVNTDIITTIIEYGSGGGFFIDGTQEFMVVSGKGLISYRKPDIKAIVVSENQVVNFNIQDGFVYPKLASQDILNSYLIFQNTPYQKENINKFPSKNSQETNHFYISEKKSTTSGITTEIDLIP